MFGGEIMMLPERRGNRMTATVINNKTEALGWRPQFLVRDYIEELRDHGWVNKK